MQMSGSPPSPPARPGLGAAHLAEPDMRELDRTMSDRRATLRLACPPGATVYERARRVLAERLNWAGGAILVDDRHKILVCAPPFSGATQWKRAFLSIWSEGLDVDRLVPLLSDTYQHNIHTASLLNLRKFLQKKSWMRGENVEQDQIVHLIDNYRKVLVVRSPLDRLMAVFREKFVDDFRGYELPEETAWMLGAPLPQRFHLDPSAMEAVRKQLNFTQFARMVGERGEATSAAAGWRARQGAAGGAASWAVMSDYCLACDLGYDLVLRYETMAREAAYAVERLDVAKYLGEGLLPGGGGAVSHPPADPAVLAEACGNLTLAEVNALRAVYADDLALFGYRICEGVGR